jgi:hypothetical protein
VTSSSAINEYETLRAAVLRGEASPEGLGAIVYHGLIDGLAVLTRPMSRPVPITERTPSGVVTRDPALLRLLANMVLQSQSGIKHVY